jgi:hypothetical protein
MGSTVAEGVGGSGRFLTVTGKRDESAGNCAAGMVDAKLFDRAMLQLYEEACAIGYNATYFVRMLSEQGGVATAKQLVTSSAPSEGFTKLWELKRLDISVEALVLKPDWRELFTADEIKRARERLEQYGYRPHR